ncbi:MAG: hypothetical protein IJ525_00570 [Alphaproteobacteria bacterium]|nr:hypothetical protein [Alphaproteobacteria bacterium]
MNNLKIKNQNGRSMIEMLGVLAIIGVLSVGGIAGYSKAMMKYRINKTIEQITLIAGNVRTFFSNQRNYDGVYCYCYSAGCSGQSSKDGCPIVKKAKIFPDEMVTVDSATGKITAITGAFGNAVSLQDDGGYIGLDGFMIYVGSIPQEACIEIVSQDWSTANITAVGAYIGGGEHKHAVTPVDLELANTICEDLANHSSYDLTFFVDVKNFDSAHSSSY